VHQEISGLIGYEIPLVLSGYRPIEVGWRFHHEGHFIRKKLPFLEFLRRMRLVPFDEKESLGNRLCPGLPVEIRKAVDEVVEEESAVGKLGDAGGLVQGPTIEFEGGGVKKVCHRTLTARKALAEAPLSSERRQRYFLRVAGHVAQAK